MGPSQNMPLAQDDGDDWVGLKSTQLLARHRGSGSGPVNFPMTRTDQRTIQYTKYKTSVQYMV